MHYVILPLFIDWMLFFVIPVQISNGALSCVDEGKCVIRSTGIFFSIFIQIPLISLDSVLVR